MHQNGRNNTQDFTNIAVRIESYPYTAVGDYSHTIMSNLHSEREELDPCPILINGPVAISVKHFTSPK